MKSPKNSISLSYTTLMKILMSLLRIKKRFNSWSKPSKTCDHYISRYYYLIFNL